MDDTGDPGEPERPPIVGAADAALIGRALAGGGIIAVPGVGGYVLAVRAGIAEAEGRLDQLVADPDGPHYAVGHRDAVPALTSGWTDEVAQLLERCWPGPLEVFLPRVAGDSGRADTRPAAEGSVAGGGALPTDAHGGWAVTVGMPDGRALRRLCREHGPWRTVPLTFTDAAHVAHAFDAADVALVVDGGTRDGPPTTLVDATTSPVSVLREGALPANFIEGAMLVGTRKRWFSRGGRSERPAGD